METWDRKDSHDMKLFQLCLLSLLAQQVVAGSKLMVLMLDGFRWDYVERYTNKQTDGQGGFSRLAQGGVMADHITSAFPSVTYTNLYSVLTGLHPESHGMVGKNMYDPRENETFDFGFNPEQIHPHWWDGGEPVWVTAGRQNLAAFVYHWPGCEVEIRGKRPSHCSVYPGYLEDGEEAKANFTTQWRDGLRVLKTEEADLVLVYFELIDFWGHLHGPDSTEVANLVKWMDDQLNQLLEILKRGLDLDLNLIVLSDHGMTDISKSRVIDVSMTLNAQEYERMIDHGPVLSVWPKQGFEKQVYEKLQDFSSHMSVYLKNDLPSKWRLKNHFRVAPIMCFAHNGWMIVQTSEGLPKFGGKAYNGYHGFDSTDKDMRGIFYALGPNIRVGERVNAFDNIHVYQLMCRLLNIQPAPNNGSWAQVERIYTRDVVSVTCFLTSLFCIALVILIMLYYIGRTFLQAKKKIT